MIEGRGLGIRFGDMGFCLQVSDFKDDISCAGRRSKLTLSPRIPDPKSGEALANAALQEKKWLVRAAAFDAIAKRGDPSLKGTAVSGLTDEQEEVQYAAAAAVIRLTDIEAAPKAHPQKRQRK